LIRWWDEGEDGHVADAERAYRGADAKYSTVLSSTVTSRSDGYLGIEGCEGIVISYSLPDETRDERDGESGPEMSDRVRVR